MSDNIENLVLEHLKAIQSEQASSRERDSEMMRRLANIETMVARLGRDQAQAFSDQVDDRHSIDQLRHRLDRIEKRLDLVDNPA